MRLVPTLLIVAAAAGLAGCGPGAGKDTPPLWILSDMKAQEKYKPQQESPLFADHSASRKPVTGTVARETYFEDEGYHFGIVGGQYVGKNPLELNEKVLAHGQKKFNVYCAPCHDRTASGGGIVASAPARPSSPPTCTSRRPAIRTTASSSRSSATGAGP